MKLASGFLFIAILAAADSIRLEYEAVQPEVIQQRLEMVSRKLDERRATLESLFEHAGCDGASLTTQAVRGSKAPNIICTLPSEGAGEIVVGGHFDFIDRGAGVVDDWSGAALLPSLYQSLKTHPRHHRFRFVAFAGEEMGLYGSRQYVKALSPEEKKATRAMINLECLGMDTPKVWASRADHKLLAAYSQAVAILHLPASASNVDRVGDDDSHPFLDAGIPVLTIHSVTSANIGLLHSPQDNLKAIRPTDYYNSYRLAAVYLTYLDSKLE